MVEEVWAYLLCCGIGSMCVKIQYTFGYAASFAPRGKQRGTRRLRFDGDLDRRRRYFRCVATRDCCLGSPDSFMIRKPRWSGLERREKQKQ